MINAIIDFIRSLFKKESKNELDKKADKLKEDLKDIQKEKDNLEVEDLSPDEVEDYYNKENK